MVVMGQIIGSFGVYGWVKVFPFTESVDGLLSYPVWWIGKGDGKWCETKVTKSNVHTKILVSLLEQCTDRTAAMKLKDMLIAVPRSQLPSLSNSGKDGYYWEDLIGLKVVNLQNEVLGSVVGIMASSSNDILQIQNLNEGESERLIPFINKVIVNVDFSTCRIIVDWESDYLG